MKQYVVTYAWTWGNITETVLAASEEEARDTFIRYISSKYDQAMQDAACFRILDIVPSLQN